MTRAKAKPHWTDALQTLGMKKADLARALGVKAGTVYRWTDATVPRYATAYLEGMVRLTAALEVIREKAQPV